MNHTDIGVEAYDPTVTATMPTVELCVRCGAEMEWRHSTWQCPRCQLKLGCCEGDAPGCDAEPG